MNMFDDTCLALISDVDQDKQMFGSDQRSLTHLLVHTNRDIKGDKTKIDKNIQLNTKAK